MDNSEKYLSDDLRRATMLETAVTRNNIRKGLQLARARIEQIFQKSTP
jgi:hypothetical protein